LITAIKAGDAVVTAHAQAAHVDIPVHVAQEPLTTVIASPSVGCPYGVAVSSTGVGYVTSICGSTVARFDEPSHSVNASVTVGSAPAHVALNPAGTVAYVANQTGESVSVVDVATNAVTATLPLTGADVYNLKVSPDGKRLYVTRQDGTLYVIDAATLAILKTVTVGFGPNGLAFHPTQPILYVSAIQSGNVSVVNTNSYTVTNTYTVGGMPQRIAVSPDGIELYVANEQSGLNIINLTTGAISSVPLNGTAIGLVLTSTGDYVYVALANGGTVKVVDVGTRAVYRTINTGGDPRNMAIASDGTIIVADQSGFLRFIH
jgi:YVTN family beta-propeller protein